MTIALATLAYLACASAATYPVVTRFGSEIPGDLTDPLEHLWLMRWSKACLLEGRSPVFCPELNAPTGVPLGYFPTLHAQTFAYLLLGLVTANDVACYDAIWFGGLVATGMGTFVMAWWVVRKIGPAWLAGLGAMLSGPLMMHAHGHLETMQVGPVPLFLVAWLRFVDRPGRTRLMVAVGLYLLMVACAPYFAVLGVFPAAWYVAWSLIGTGDRKGWLLGRIGWLLAFGAMAVLGLSVLFANQVWSATHGYSMARSRLQFDQFGAPSWSMFVPSPLHALGRIDVFVATSNANRMIECSSYLGILAIAALAYAAIRRLPFPRAGYWWSVLLMMVVLSWGTELDLGWARIKMPAGWIYSSFPPFHLIRVPARFNLFASVSAAVPVSATLADLMSRFRRPMTRGLFLIGCAGVMLADLAMVPFATSSIPPMPGVYRDLACRNPEKTILDAPMFDSNEGQTFSALWGYWQSSHRLRTSAGYPGLPNVPYESEIVRASPFWGPRLLDAAYLVDPAPTRFGAANGLEPRDYAWLFLTVHHYDHVVLHQGIYTDQKYAAGNERIKALLAEAKVFEDADVAAFDRARLRPPDHLTWLCVDGFRSTLAKPRSRAFGLLREARIAIVNPTPGRPMVLELVDASAFVRRRLVSLVEGTREIARWTVEPGVVRTLVTPPFRLVDGVRELSLIADGDDRPVRYTDRLDDARTPYSLRLDAVRVRLVDDDVPGGR